MSDAAPLALLRAAIEGEGEAAPLGPALRALLTGGTLAREVALAALGIAADGAAAFARHERDAWLAEAARLALPGGRTWAKARALHGLAVASRRARARLSTGELLTRYGPAAVALQRAERWGDVPSSPRRLYDALRRADAEPLVPSVSAGLSSPHHPPRQREAA